MDSRQSLVQLLVPGILMLAAAGANIENLDRTGAVTIREAPSGAVDLFKPDGTRAGYGVQRRDRSIDLFRPDGSRIGHIQPVSPAERPGATRIFLSPTKRR
jgi:hypothetical protein